MVEDVNEYLWNRPYNPPPPPPAPISQSVNAVLLLTDVAEWQTDVAEWQTDVAEWQTDVAEWQGGRLVSRLACQEIESVSAHFHVQIQLAS